MLQQACSYIAAGATKNRQYFTTYTLLLRYRQQIKSCRSGKFCFSQVIRQIMLSTIVALTSKLFKPFLQSRERDDLTVVFVIHYPINSYDNPTRNHCSERDPPRPRSEHKFYGIFLLINTYTAIYIYRRLSRDVPVFAQIGTAGSQTNQADSSKPNTIRKNQDHGGVILRRIIKNFKQPLMISVEIQFQPGGAAFRNNPGFQQRIYLPGSFRMVFTEHHYGPC